jgi:hypothetical protein
MLGWKVRMREWQRILLEEKMEGEVVWEVSFLGTAGPV